MPNLSRFSRVASAALAVAVLGVSLCAARCVVPAVAAPCHGEPAESGPCAALSSQTWLVSPDITATLLLAALFLLFAASFSAAPRLVLVLPGLAWTQPFAASPPRLRLSVNLSPRAPPRRR